MVHSVSMQHPEEKVWTMILSWSNTVALQNLISRGYRAEYDYYPVPRFIADILSMLSYVAAMATKVCDGVN